MFKTFFSKIGVAKVLAMDKALLCLCFPIYVLPTLTRFTDIPMHVNVFLMNVYLQNFPVQCLFTTVASALTI